MTCVTEPERCVDAVEQSADDPQLRLLDELDVDQNERQVVVEAGQERLANDGPRAHGPPPADGA